MFAFWVERLADKKRGLGAISFDPARVSDELRPEFTKLLRDLQRMTGETVLNNGNYPSEAIGFVTVSDGLAVIRALDQFVGDAFDRLGTRAFAPYDPTQRGGRKKKSSETSLLTWDADSAPPGVDPKVWAQIRPRRGQQKFRQRLMRAYDGRCAVTGCSVEAALEAAHVTPYSHDAVYEVTDGVLLRADVHTLFDLHLISVDPATYTVRVALSLLADYGAWNGQPLRLPADGAQYPCAQRLEAHYAEWRRLAVTRG
ncbi:HNH endonuclease [Pelomonas sp. UHG3]|uniref:HNH endonuclease n=1 Tax=Roseateles hydrophilus TaxID=2975054 RepID=A0ACC6CB45_9BURK|nr:HNH endonuclease [Pelomonas sp. UHG3]MCY4745656.1 HNH endonuclease [Pelomonas sp. UHG3]